MTVLQVHDAVPRLREALHRGRLIPFLGAGFSMPLRLPSWTELVAWMAERLGWEPELFALHGTAAQMAEFFALEPNALDELVHEMTVRFDGAEAQARRRDSPTHRALAARAWRTIYTTNFDRHIEGALADAGKPYQVLAALGDFLLPRPEHACEVVKFHGTLSRKETMVLRESDYFARMDLNAAVDQRLRADLLGHSFLFIGYSFTDTNIRYIWYRMNKLLAEQHASVLPRRSYFVSFGAGPVQPRLLERWNIDVIELDPADMNASVAALLNGIE